MKLFFGIVEICLNRIQDIFIIFVITNQGKLAISKRGIGALIMASHNKKAEINSAFLQQHCYPGHV